MSGDLIPKRIVRSDGVETTVWVKPNASDQAASRLAGISVTPVVGTEKEARRKRAAESGIDPDEWAGDFTDAGLIRQYRSSWKHAARLQERGDTDLGPQDEMAAVRDEAQQRGLDLPSDAEIAERMRLEQLIASESADGVAPDDYDAGDPLRRALASVRRGHTYEEAAELVWNDWNRPSLPEMRQKVTDLLTQGAGSLSSDAGHPSPQEYARYLDYIVGEDPMHGVPFSEAMRRLDASLAANDSGAAALAAGQAVAALDASAPNNEGLDAESAAVVWALTESLDRISDDLHRTLQRIALQR